MGGVRNPARTQRSSAGHATTRVHNGATKCSRGTSLPPERVFRSISMPASPLANGREIRGCAATGGFGMPERQISGSPRAHAAARVGVNTLPSTPASPTVPLASSTTPHTCRPQLPQSIASPRMLPRAASRILSPRGIVRTGAGICRTAGGDNPLEPSASSNSLSEAQGSTTATEASPRLRSAASRPVLGASALLSSSLSANLAANVFDQSPGALGGLSSPGWRRGRMPLLTSLLAQLPAQNSPAQSSLDEGPLDFLQSDRRGGSPCSEQRAAWGSPRRKAASGERKCPREMLSVSMLFPKALTQRTPIWRCPQIAYIGPSMPWANLATTYRWAAEAAPACRQRDHLHLRLRLGSDASRQCRV